MLKSFYLKIKQNPAINTILIRWLIGFGIFLRVKEYLDNRSLRLDEALFAANIIQRSFAGLMQPLAYSQTAPIGFRMIEKAFVLSFGNNEYALRLFPLLCGIISIFIFYKIAKHYLTVNAAAIALFLFVFSKGLIFYSSDAKQYSSDVAIALFLYLAVIYIQAKGPGMFRSLLFASIGAAAIWFSHTAVFVLAGIGISLSLFYLSAKKYPETIKLVFVCLIWLLSFAACYSTSLEDLSYHKPLLDGWKDYFISFPPHFIQVKNTFSYILRSYFSDMFFVDITALAFFIGCIALFLKKKRDFFILLLPLAMVLIASMLHKYPFSGRLLLFFVPVMLLFIAQGIDQIREKTFNKIPALSIIIIGLLLGGTFYEAFDFNNPFINKDLEVSLYRDGIKPALNYIQGHRQDKDTLYVYYPGIPAFKYYADRYGLAGEDTIKGVFCKSDWLAAKNDIDNLRGKQRVWFIFSDMPIRTWLDEEKFAISYLDTIGKRLDTFQGRKASVYLYDLSGVLK